MYCTFERCFWADILRTIMFSSAKSAITLFSSPLSTLFFNCGCVMITKIILPPKFLYPNAYLALTTSYAGCDYNSYELSVILQGDEKPFVELTYLSLQWMTYINIGKALKSPSLKFIINLLDPQKVHLVLLQRNLIVFSCFRKHVATNLRL